MAVLTAPLRVLMVTALFVAMYPVAVIGAVRKKNVTIRIGG